MSTSSGVVAEYWKAASEGRLRVRHCRSCDRAHHYPRQLCPYCLGADTCWRDHDGKGEVYSFTVGQEPDPVILAFVRLEDAGVVMLTHLVDCHPDELRIGMKVQAVFRELGEVIAPVFAPC